MIAKNKSQIPTGIGVDAAGSAVIDPTQNVRELVLAESKYQDAARNSLKELMNAEQNGLREIVKVLTDSLVMFQNAQRDSETRRIDQLAETRQEFQNTIRDMLAESVRTTSTLVSTQLVQIQATFDTRVSKLEAGAFIQAGRSSVADPASDAAMVRMQGSISNLASATTESMNRMATTSAEALAKITLSLGAIQSSESRTGGQAMGKQDTNARLLAVVMAVAAVASPVIAILVTIMAIRGH